eukprot:scaffold97116_cov55-Cyclotella_meneghiniana.AAC.1
MRWFINFNTNFLAVDFNQGIDNISILRKILFYQELDQSGDSVGKPRNRAVSWSSDIDLSPNALDSPVVVSKGIGAE